MEYYEEAFQYPSLQESKQIRDSFPPVKEIYFRNNGIEAKKEYFKQDFENFIAQHDITNWITIFDNTLGKIRFSYVLSKFYHSKGIEDDIWKVDLDTGSTKFFPELEDDGDRYIQFLFNYSIENFYYRYFASLDRLAQLLNIYYNLGIDENRIYLNDKFIEALRKVDKELGDTLNNYIECIKPAKNDRNSLAHRFPFNEIDIRSQKYKDENGGEVTTLGTARYTNSKEVMCDVESSIELLSKIFRAIESALTTKNS